MALLDQPGGPQLAVLKSRGSPEFPCLARHRQRQRWFRRAARPESSLRSGWRCAESAEPAAANWPGAAAARATHYHFRPAKQFRSGARRTTEHCRASRLEADRSCGWPCHWWIPHRSRQQSGQEVRQDLQERKEVQPMGVHLEPPRRAIASNPASPKRARQLDFDGNRTGDRLGVRERFRQSTPARRARRSHDAATATPADATASTSADAHRWPATVVDAVAARRSKNYP